MKKRYIQTLILIPVIILLSSVRVLSQIVETENYTTIESVVKDDNGNPIEGAIIYGDEGSVVIKTDALGKFTISVTPAAILLIEREGFESAIYRVADSRQLKEFILQTSLFHYSERDIVNIAFKEVKSGDLVNSVSVINPVEILQYDNIQGINQILTGRIPGLYGSSRIRGIGDALYIVDGLPRDINTIDLSEIEQITVLKDINSSILYGSAAVNGVILITTKRGEAYKKKLNISGWYGVSMPISTPEYLSSADYMSLYNEARLNDSLPVLYSASEISKYRSSNYRYPSLDYYSDEFLRSSVPFSKIMAEVSGGNEVATYYSNVGLDESGSILDFGDWKSAKYRRFNVRGNVDLKVNDWIKTSLDGVAFYNNARTPGGDYWTAAATMKPNLFAPLIPTDLINPDIDLGNANIVNGKYLIGGRNNNLTHPIGDAYSGGMNENIQRTFSINNRIEFDLKHLVEGLKFHTNISFDFSTSYDQAIRNEYAVFEPIWNSTEDMIDSLVQYGQNQRTGTQVVGNSTYYRRMGFYGLFDYDRTFNGVNHFNASFIMNGNFAKGFGDIQGIKNANLGLRVGYIYDKKYMIDFSGSYNHSVKLPEGNRDGFSPSLGIAWVISSEDFMSSISAIDYLKLRFTGGVINSDLGIADFYLYDDIYDRSGFISWADGSYYNLATSSIVGRNDQLFFEKRSELNLGFEASLLNKMLSVEASIFTSIYSDKLARAQTLYPSFYSNFIPYENLNKDGYKGAELGLSINRNIGELSINFGANMMYAVSEILDVDELVEYDYQKTIGRPKDAIWGLVSDGFFMDQDDIDNHESQTFGEVRPGDIKYVDQNDDGRIDQNDQVQIGRYYAPFSYGLNLRLSYKNFTLFALGDGRMGGDALISGDYYQVDGDDKYSSYVVNRWTEDTKSIANYPRLSTLTSNNNFLQSDFWLYKNNYFSLHRVQLTYKMPEAVANILFMKNLDLFVNGSNLLLVSKYKEISQLRIGSEPSYRSFSLGIKTMF